jgi:hypothetical protein
MEAKYTKGIDPIQDAGGNGSIGSNDVPVKEDGCFENRVQTVTGKNFPLMQMMQNG